MKTVNVQPFDGPEFDTPPEATPERTRTYVVCSTPRSGSGLLCRALAATGVAGLPLEYFDVSRRGQLTQRWGCGQGLREYTAALQARRTGSGGVFGMKLHWEHVERFRAEAAGRGPGGSGFDQPASLVEEIVGDAPAYLHISRRDVDRQAVSLWTAHRTGVWSTNGDSGGPSPRVPYSFSGIQRCRQRIALGELHWDRFFRFNGITPIAVEYEDLSVSFESTVTGVLRELVPGAAADIPPPATVAQADERSEELLERFLRDLERRHPLALRDRLYPRVRGLLRRG